MNRFRLIRNAILTPDGTILESRHRHDFQSHLDANGKQYFVDGGLDYCRRSADDQSIDLCVYLEDEIDVIRDVVSWGTRGKDGNQPVRRILLKDMSDTHIQACLDTQQMMHPHYREAFTMELRYRRSHGITVEDVT